MPHLFTNRPRTSDPRHGDQRLQSGFRWERINAVLYEVGGVLFLVGSLFFFPLLEHWKDIGAWLFFVGSLVYLAVLLHDLSEIQNFWPKKRLSPSRMLEVVAIWSYIVGTLLFTVGSLFFLSWWDWVSAGAWCFIVGSALFVAGACVNVLMIIRASSLFTLQLMNLTAVNFVLGSALFVAASVPYLWQMQNPLDESKLFAFLAWQFTIGSALFLIGGFVNHYRTRLVIQQRLADMADDPQADERLLAFVRGEIDERRYREGRSSTA